MHNTISDNNELVTAIFFSESVVFRFVEFCQTQYPHINVDTARISGLHTLHLNM